MIITFGASLRKDSLNKKLAKVVHALLGELSVPSEYVDFRDFAMPVFDEDLETEQGIPAGAQKLIETVRRASALVIASPEYNGSIPGALKNAVDWVSRDKNPLANKPVLLIATSPGGFGGIRALWHTRVPFEALDACVYPGMFSLPKGHEHLVEEGKLTDSRANAQLHELLKRFSEFAHRLSG